MKTFSVSRYQVMAVTLAAVAVTFAGCSSLGKLGGKSDEERAREIIEGSTGKSLDEMQYKRGDSKAAGENTGTTDDTGTGMGVGADAQGSVEVNSADGTMNAAAGDKALARVRQYINLPTWITTDAASGVALNDYTSKVTIYGSLVSQKSYAETKAFWVSYFSSEGYTGVTQNDNGSSFVISGKKGEATKLSVTVSNKTPVNMSITYNGTK